MKKSFFLIPFFTLIATTTQATIPFRRIAELGVISTVLAEAGYGIYASYHMHNLHTVTQSGTKLLRAIKAQDIAATRRYASRLKQATDFTKELGGAKNFLNKCYTFVDWSSLKYFPLSEAVETRNAEIVKILLDHGADPKQPGNDKMTALELSSQLAGTEFNPT